MNLLYQILNNMLPLVWIPLYCMLEPWKVSEYADGGNLLTLQKRRGRFTVDELMFYAAEIILGILALHEYNICHRFIAPETVLISATGHCKIGRLHKVMYKKTELQGFYLSCSILPQIVKSWLKISCFT